MQRLAAAIRKEFLQFWRDRMLVALVVFIYTADVVICTVALTFDVKNLTVAVFDQDRTQLSARLVERFSATDYFGRLVPVERFGEIDLLLDRGEVDLALVIPPDFARHAASGAPAEVQVLLAGLNSNTANAARGYVNVILGRFAHELLAQAAAARGISTDLPEVVPEIRIWYNPQLEFKHFMAVSMIVVASLTVGVITTAASLVRERETGTIEQLAVTPLRVDEIILAKALPPFAICMISLVPSLLIGMGFGVPAQGALELFVLASVLSLAGSMGIGVFIAGFAESLQQALLIGFFVIFPLMFLSGTTVPIDSMPRVMQVLSLVSPTRYYMEIALGTLLKGVGWSALWPQLLGLTAIGGAMAFAGWARLARGGALIGRA
ncbi:MAG TPA: ABC transporter permease [Burkholderiales bacterium]|nr:ABC transporter permease [Burkholderiales bacterium]